MSSPARQGVWRRQADTPRNGHNVRCVCPPPTRITTHHRKTLTERKSALPLRIAGHVAKLIGMPSYSRHVGQGTHETCTLPLFPGTALTCPPQRSSSSRQRLIRPSRGSASCRLQARSRRVGQARTARRVRAKRCRRRTSRCAWGAPTSCSSTSPRTGGSPRPGRFRSPPPNCDAHRCCTEWGHRAGRRMLLGANVGNET